MKSKFSFLKSFVPIFIFLLCLSFFSCSPDIYYEDDNTAQLTDVTDTTVLSDDSIEVEDNISNPLTSFEEVADYIKANGELPDNFITKSDARDLGWDSSKGNLDEVAPGKSIGGDRFYNNEKRLPEEPGRIYYECDINYESGYRGGERLVFSNDGLIFKTEDHYETFEEIE